MMVILNGLDYRTIWLRDLNSYFMNCTIEI